MCMWKRMQNNGNSMGYVPPHPINTSTIWMSTIYSQRMKTFSIWLHSIASTNSQAFQFKAVTPKHNILTGFTKNMSVEDVA